MHRTFSRAGRCVDLGSDLLPAMRRPTDTRLGGSKQKYDERKAVGVLNATAAG
jgi:hypothetical protein